MAAGPPAPRDVRQAATPHFVVAIVNETTVLRCRLSAGASLVTSDPATLPAPRPSAFAERQIAATGRQSDFAVRCILYSPNLVADEYPQFAWDADLDINGTSFFVGSVRQRCEVIEHCLTIKEQPTHAQLRLTRVRLAAVRSRESEELAQKVVQLFQDSSFNPRSGSLQMPTVADAVRTRFPAEYATVVDQEHLGSFRAFLTAHEERFAIFHYRDREIEHRQLSNVSAHDERVAIKKEVRDSHPPMLPPGHPNEQRIVELIKEKLRDQDSHVHTLMRQLSQHDEFRIGMSAAFSSLMHLLQKYRDTFRWSTDPQQICTIGLVGREPTVPVRVSKDDDGPHLPMDFDDIDMEFFDDLAGEEDATADAAAASASPDDAEEAS